ncbi:MAG: ATP-binding protein [Actinomycetota bacterium]
MAASGGRSHSWRTMRVRTTVAASVVVGMALLVGGLGLLAVLKESLEDNVETSARLRADDVAALIGSGLSPEDLSVEDPPDDDISAVQVVDASGRVLVASANMSGEPAVADLADGGSTRVRGLSISPEDSYLVVAKTADTSDGPVTVLVARGLEPTGETVASVARALAVGLPVLLLLVSLTTWVVVGRALRPVAAISAEVRSITDAELDRRVPEPEREDEIGQLARTMNAMLERLQRARDRQRQFVSDASHELRSPIASIRHQLEVALAHRDSAELSVTAEGVLQEDLRMQQIVEDLLLLARGDEGAGAGRRQPVDLDDIALAEAKRLRSGGGPSVDTTEVRAARVAGDPAHLARAVRNLVDNAARHASTRVAVSVGIEGSTAVLRVDDDGPGVTPGDRERIFERFTRLDDARTRGRGGSGLGLAIVAQVVADHSGEAQCLAAPGGGARFEMRLPAIDVV